MRRTKFILLALVAALVLMGAAYAAWTQSFVINSTVETGELFVKVENTENKVMVVDGSGEYKETRDGGLNLSNLVTSTSENSADGSKNTLTTISYNVGNVYPGTKIISKFSFTNLGTINAVTSATNPAVSDNELWNQFVIRVNGVAVTGDTANAKLANLRDAIRNAVGSLEISASKQVTIEQELPYDSTNAVENKKLEWSVSLTFTQSQN